MGMKRRNFLLGAMALSAGKTALAAEQPWSARLLKGGFDGEVWWSGLAIKLGPKWKTYWRVPGDGGIAPSFTVAGENIKSSRIEYPVPTRMAVELVGTVIGYADEVVFPIAISPVEVVRPVSLELKSFFGVCDEICIPASFNSNLAFDPAQADAPDQFLLSQWHALVPVLVMKGPVTKAIAKQEDSGVFVAFETTQPIKRIFVEGNPTHYFSGPVLVDARLRMKVMGAKSVDEVRATPLRITMQTDTKVLEQIVHVV
jgi:DsbC/DsbD-like thiol-disulfide interchange protein